MKPKKEEENKLVDSTPLTNKEREEFEELKIQYEIKKKELLDMGMNF